jgi:hypothetical protein
VAPGESVATESLHLIHSYKEYNLGCFNKSCVITGLQITNNDPIVGIKVKKASQPRVIPRGVDFDHIGSEWYPVEFPIRGTYDDYGRIVVDGKLYEGGNDTSSDADSTRCDDYMFVHAWAHDYVLEYAAQESKEYQERYTKPGDKDWEQEDWDTIKTAFESMKSGIAAESDTEYMDQFKDPDQKSKMVKYLSEMVIRSMSEKWLQSYFARENKNYWFKKLYVEDYDMFKANIQRFRDELGTLESYRFELGFQWHPSYVANQDVSYNLRLGLLNKSETYLKDKMSEYGYDQDEDE